MPDDLIDRVGSAPRLLYRGTGFRHLAPQYDPMSGEGARMHGGRFNPPDSYPVLYLCTTQACAAAEFMRYATQQPIGPAGFLPRHLYRYDVEFTAVLDLTDSATTTHLAIDPAQIVDEDRTLPREIGELAHRCGYQAVLARSATGVDAVLAVLIENLGTGRLDARLERVWAHLDDLPVF